MNRRNFLKHTGLVSTAAFVPQFLSGFGQIALENKGKNFVVIQWAGGNDGLNTVVPYQNDLYYKNRPNISIPAKEVLKLNDELGFNPVLKGLKSLYDDGLVTVLNSVGYPNPDRSHFRSMDIWHTASDADEYLNTGWLGRYLDLKNDMPYTAIEVDDNLSLALKGYKKSGFAVSNITRLKKTAGNPFLKTVATHHDHSHEENVAYLYRTLIETQSSADYLYNQSRIFTSKKEYPNNRLGRELKQIAELIIAGTGTKIYYVNMSGFDTHVNQRNQQERQLENYAEAIEIFIKDLKHNNRLDDTLVMTFSEFGRRVKQNASRGTDHGTANNLYLIGGKLKNPGIFNAGPDLSNLDNGDLMFQIDFRNVYASILENWLDLKPSSVLQKNFSTLNLI